MTFLMPGGNLDVNVSPTAPGSLFDVRTSVGHFRCTYSSQHFFRNELNPTISCLAAHFVQYIYPGDIINCVLLRSCLSVMYNDTVLLCYNCTMTGLILIIFIWIVFCFWRSFFKWRRYLDLDSFPEWHNEEVWFHSHSWKILWSCYTPKN